MYYNALCFEMYFVFYLFSSEGDVNSLGGWEPLGIWHVSKVYSFIHSPPPPLKQKATFKTTRQNFHLSTVYFLLK